MPQPTPSDVHLNVPLTNISVAYIQSAADFVAPLVFPNIPVAQQSNRYYSYPKGYWFRTEAKKRGLSAESAGSGFTVDNTPTYFAHVYAVHKDVDDQVRANQDNPLNVDRDATMFVTQQMLIKRDYDWADAYFKTGVWGTDLTGVTGTPGATEFKQWDQSGSDPIKDIRTKRIAVKEATGFWPNTLVIGPYVENVLLNHSLVLDRIKYTQTGIAGLDLLAALFGVQRVVTAAAIQNTAAEGAADSLSFIFGKNALLLYVNPNPGIMTPSAGYTFSWNGYLGMTGLGARVTRFRMENLKSDRVELEMAYDMKLVGSDLGVFFSGAVA